MSSQRGLQIGHRAKKLRGDRFGRGARKTSGWRSRTVRMRRLGAEWLEDRRMLSGLSLGGLVWHDLDANGLQDPGEPGIEAAVVELYQSADLTVGNDDDVSLGLAITGSHGMYLFEGLVEGNNYYAQVRTPPAFEFTTQDVGTDDALDSDVDAVGFSGMVTLTAGPLAADLDAGLKGDTPAFGFVFAVGGREDDRTSAMARDAAGNIYITGTFEQTADFDPGPGEWTLTSVGETDVFIAKYTSAGALCWARSVGGVESEYSVGIGVGPHGEVFIAGTFRDTADFDPGPGRQELTPTDRRDSFVLKLDSQGDFLWVSQLRSSFVVEAQSFVVGPDGRAYTAGTFRGVADFDPGPGTYNLDSGGWGAMFLSALDAEGNLVWARCFGYEREERVGDLALGPDGSLYVTGRFAYKADFDPGPGVWWLTSAGWKDAFVCRFSAHGNLVWAGQMGGPSTDEGYSVAVGADGSVYVGGEFRGTADFDPGPGTFNLTPDGTSDNFLCKLNPNGTLAWARQQVGGNDVAVGWGDRVYSVGFANHSADFFVLTTDGEPVASGTYLRGPWTGPPYGQLAITLDGSVYIAANLYRSKDADPSPQSWSISTAGSHDWDVCLWKLRGDYGPADLLLSSNQVVEHSPTGTIVGQLVVRHPHPGESSNFELLDSAGGRFRLAGTQIQVDDGSLLDYDQAQSHRITVRVRDSLGFELERTLPISVVDSTDKARLRGRVWHDRDGDGIQDAGEPGVEAAVVELYGSTDGIVGNKDDHYLAREITGADGEYLFDHRVVGTYYLLVRPPVEFAFTSQHAGTDDALDSDVNGVGLSAVFTLEPGTLHTGIDAGLVGSEPGFGFALGAGELPSDYWYRSGYSTVDAEGNVYVAWQYTDTVDFDAGPGVYNLDSLSGHKNLFVAKYTRGGALCWARSAGVLDDSAQVTGVAAGPDGSVHVVGDFDGTIDFDPGPGIYEITRSIYDEVFVWKLDAEGNFAWAGAMGRPAGGDEGHDIAVGPDGSVYTTGVFSSGADFDPGPGTYTLESAGWDDVFVCKWDSQGRFVWARNVGGENWEYSAGIAVGLDGSVYTTGNFTGTADFDPGPSTRQLSSAGRSDVFVLKLNPQGNFVWARSMGGEKDDTGLDIAVGPDGSVYTTGYSKGTADFDPGPGTWELPGLGKEDVFVSKLDAQGNFVWARRMGGNNEDRGYGIALGPDGSVFTTGYFMGTADFDPGPGTRNLVSSGWEDVFVSKLDSQGELVWAARTDAPEAYSVSVGPDGSVFTTGLFSGKADFDPSRGVWNLNIPGRRSAFLWKLRGDYGPADLTLSPASVLEHSPTGTVVGELAAEHPNSHERLTFELLDSAGGRFMLVGNQIQVDDGTLLDFSQAASHQITVRVRDSLGITLEKTLSIEVISEDHEGPRVTGVFLRSSQWSDGFLDTLDSAGLGHPSIARLGYGVPAGPNQMVPLTWTGLDTLTLVFDEDVVVDQGDLGLYSVRVSEYDTAGGTFHYDPATHAATWSLPEPLAAEKLLVRLAGVDDIAGNQLDGEWTDQSSTFPSGDGTPGGDFLFRFNVLPADVTGDGMVISNDAVWVGNALGTAPPAGGYSPLMDLSGDGLIISNDLVRVFNHLGTALPDGEPQVPDPLGGNQAETDLFWLPETLPNQALAIEPVEPEAEPTSTVSLTSVKVLGELHPAAGGHVALPPARVARAAHGRPLLAVSEAPVRPVLAHMPLAHSQSQAAAADRVLLAWAAAEEPLARSAVRDALKLPARWGEQTCAKERLQVLDGPRDPARNEVLLRIVDYLPAEPLELPEAVGATDGTDRASGAAISLEDWDHALVAVAAEIDGQAISEPLDRQAGEEPGDRQSG